MVIDQETRKRILVIFWIYLATPAANIQTLEARFYIDSRKCGRRVEQLIIKTCFLCSTWTGKKNFFKPLLA